MKKLILLLLAIQLFSSCDPEYTADTYIQNSTYENLEVFFVSTIFLDKTVKINSGEAVFFSSHSKIGSKNLEGAFHDYDSIYIQNESNEVLKIYKPNTPDKNIYKREYWITIKEEKRTSKYAYEITDEDIE